MERTLTNQELHEFAQWFSFHYGGGIGGVEEENKHPREEIIDLVDIFIKNKPQNGYSNKGFVKWFSEEYKIYEKFIKEILNKKDENIQEWIDHHFKKGNVMRGLIHYYYQDKIKGNVFEEHCFGDLKKQLDKSGVKMIDENGEEFK